MAAQTAQTVERPGGPFHVPMRQAFREAGVGLAAVKPGPHACDILLVRGSVDGEVPEDRHMAQGLDLHHRLGGFPAGEDLAAIHANGAGTALLRSAVPAVAEILFLVLDDVVEYIQDAHEPGPGNLEVLQVRRVVPGGIEAPQPDQHRVAFVQAVPPIGDRVSGLHLTQASGVFDVHRRVHWFLDRGRQSAATSPRRSSPGSRTRAS